MSPEPAPAPISDRRHDLDWIRIGAFVLLILYHVGMFYVTWDWHVKSPEASHTIEPLMLLTGPWRLTLLFLVSGAASAFMLRRMSAGGFAWSRIGRLLPPLLLAVFVIVPPQTWYEILEKAPHLSESYPDFWLKYVTASGNWCNPEGECLVTPTYNHMWFVAYLFVYSLILAGLATVGRGALKAASTGLERLLSGWGVIVWPLLWFAILRLALLPLFEVTHAIWDDWYNHVMSFSAFLLGFLLIGADRVWPRFSRMRWPALVLWLLGWAAYAAYQWAYRADDAVPPEALRVVMRAAFALQQWCAIVAVLGFGRLWFTGDGPVRRYLTEAVFPFYIVHQTIIVVVAHHLAQLGLPLSIEAPLLIALTFGGCFATFELVRRIDWLRPWFGLKNRTRARQAVEALESA